MRFHDAWFEGHGDDAQSGQARGGRCLIMNGVGLFMHATQDDNCSVVSSGAGGESATAARRAAAGSIAAAHTSPA